ncbi:bifunctional hydroxymethylpyrimidine kinase/phosphomethylpyrimidine kinase [Fructilactobacillus cliffordii]|uniref:Hydroxymethylpyrimidine/phosphomethylpyrimidine kinase n=1 Tax=Fructilactobacillus cliffordii TaxID=2940299 RepID=A0A9Q8ZT05_9LACO|nr:bifunctional hydroxymethylpyrimidine kinase/phosphomethylpyrimidine kinase [Fructilactobacillus cliffordii]USS88905.1 bifunctional hydroxymethylpyrimidine kinase/phosphomethylpyrimidine kinase [Fructilactobacillus cliffordii]
MSQYPTGLTIAGTDSGGGAGMMADIKTMQTLKTFATSVIVGLTAQNTEGVQRIETVDAAMIDAQFASVAADFDVRAAKTGALFDADHVQAVVRNLARFHFPVVVVDPVMVAKGGSHLLDEAGIATLKTDLLPLADVVTPNLPEAELLAGRTIHNRVDVLNAAKQIQQLGAANVVIKGGHGTDAVVADYVKLADGTDYWMESPRVNTNRTHGTGDTLSSAIVSYVAHGMNLKQAIRQAHDYLATIIPHPLPLGHGHGPLNHGLWEEHDEI